MLKEGIIIEAVKILFNVFKQVAINDYFKFKKSIKERDYYQEVYRYKNVLSLIIDIINDGIVPGYGYERLSYCIIRLIQ